VGVLISLTRSGAETAFRAVRIGDHVYGSATPVSLPAGFRRAHADFLRAGPAIAAIRRPPNELLNYRRRGRQLRLLCLPAMPVMQQPTCWTLPVGTLIEVCVEAEGANCWACPRLRCRCRRAASLGCDAAVPWDWRQRTVNPLP
jgi:hypothetical protein